MSDDTTNDDGPKDPRDKTKESDFDRGSHKELQRVSSKRSQQSEQGEK